MKSRTLWSGVGGGGGGGAARVTPGDQPVITSKVETSSIALLSLLDSLLLASMSCSSIRFTVFLHSRFSALLMAASASLVLSYRAFSRSAMLPSYILRWFITALSCSIRTWMKIKSNLELKTSFAEL